MAGDKDGLHQQLMDAAYLKWQTLPGLKYAGFIDGLSGDEKLAVLTGNLNYQVENGGFSQWHFNDYSKGGSELYRLLRNVPGENVARVREILSRANRAVRDAEERENSRSNFWGEYSEDDGPDFAGLDDEFYAVNEAFMAEMEAHFQSHQNSPVAGE